MLNILIDPGHGKETGARFGSVLEDDINLAVSLAFWREALNARIGVNPDLTRNGSNVLPSLSQRSYEANHEGWGGKKYAAFISIHQNSATSKKAEGFQVYDYPNHPWSRDLSTCIGESLGGNSRKRWGPKFLFGNYSVLRRTKVPAVLVECGFGTNNSDLARMVDPEWQKETGSLIWKGTHRFLKLRFPTYLS